MTIPYFNGVITEVKTLESEDPGMYVPSSLGKSEKTVNGDAFIKATKTSHNEKSRR